LLPVTGIEGFFRTGSSYYILPKSKKNCNTLSKVEKGVLQFFRLSCLLLIGAEGTRLLRDQEEVTGDPAGAEEASGPPRGKRVTGAEINRTIIKDYH
ncbi:MAG: hypothetical protein Q8906_11035, partial [Bacillota bacterium]|nr:hypothetical protein [Bacillota bacterium]